MEKKRESGYYWVKLFNTKEWIIAEFLKEAEGFFIRGRIQEMFSDMDFDEINETKIPNPDEVKCKCQPIVNASWTKLTCRKCGEDYEPGS